MTYSIRFCVVVCLFAASSSRLPSIADRTLSESFAMSSDEDVYPVVGMGGRTSPPQTCQPDVDALSMLSLRRTSNDEFASFKPLSRAVVQTVVVLHDDRDDRELPLYR